MKSVHSHVVVLFLNALTSHGCIVKDIVNLSLFVCGGGGGRSVYKGYHMPSYSSCYVNELQADSTCTRYKLQSVTITILNIKYIELIIISNNFNLMIRGLSSPLLSTLQFTKLIKNNFVFDI